MIEIYINWWIFWKFVINKCYFIYISNWSVTHFWLFSTHYRIRSVRIKWICGTSFWIIHKNLIILTNVEICRRTRGIVCFEYLYINSFSPSSLAVNLYVFDDGPAGNSQFKFEVYLQPNVIYILVVTTFSPYTTGFYSLIASGLNQVNITKINNSSTLTTNILSTTRRFLFLSIMFEYQIIQVH